MAFDPGGSFFDGCDKVRELIGEGSLIGAVEVNQHYALEQHEHLGYEHPRGGKAKYLSDPLLQNTPEYVAKIVASLWTGQSEKVMAECMEDLSSRLDPEAPIDEDPNPIRLRRSGHPTVTSNGEVVYDRPPIDPREPMMAPDDLLRAQEWESKAIPSF